ncbi:MAG: YihY family inner membrane protein [Desulfobacteraceae bacterium]|nr:MAG: YihY family inner membrane protein [Desulfobacteraceae bacterium]
MVSIMLKSTWDLIGSTFQEWWKDDSFRLASSVAFYTIFSLAPILTISVGIASLVFSQEHAREQIVHQIEMLSGPQGASVVRQVLTSAAGLGRNPMAIAGAIIAMVLGSTAVFANLQSALNEIWDVEADPRGSMWKGLIRDRVRSFGIVLTLGFLLIVSMVISAILAGTQEIMADRIEGLAWLWRFLESVISFGFIALLFAAIYKYLPDVQITWRNVFMGAVITAALFTIGKYLIGLYLGHVAIGSTYGAAGSFVVLLIWVYYSVLISFLGAEFTYVYSRRYGFPIRPQPHATRRGRKSNPQPANECESPEPVNEGSGKRTGVRTKVVHENGEKTHVLIFETGEEVIGNLRAFSQREGLKSARFTAIGAFQRAVLGYFEIERKGFRRIVIDEQVEVLSLVGDIALKGRDPEIHAHVVVGKADGSAHGGHILEAYVRPTLEVVLVESPEYLCRRVDEETGLALIRL